MIITRSPLRITLGGGGTDLPSYYREYGGLTISAAINHYVYVTVIRPFEPGIYLKYSELEHADRLDEVKHPIIREALQLFDHPPYQIEITTLADIPAGTGLGSSGSFTTALIKALNVQSRRILSTQDLAEAACHIEIDRLHEPVGKQDQYAAVYGGVTVFNFNPDDSVQVSPLRIDRHTLCDLEENLLLFFTKRTRSAGSILKDQHMRTLESDQDILRNLHYVKELGIHSQIALEQGQTRRFGDLLHEHWENKRKRSKGMSNPQIDEWYELGRRNGALGGKLVGAGGGGFLLFYAENRQSLRKSMRHAGLEEVRFSFDFEGSRTFST